MKVLLVLVVLLWLGVASLAGAWVVGAGTAENGCTVVAADRGYSKVSIGWSWAPLGTTCTFDNRVSETRLVW